MQLTQTQPQPSKTWYLGSGKPYPGQDPCFFDTQDYPWVENLESQWTIIRDELDALLQANGDSLTPYFNPELVSREGVWKTFPLFFWKKKYKENCQLCPQTTAILESIPHMIGASFSMLEPDAAVMPHNGDTNAIARCHLGLLIPNSLPDCGLGVGDESRSWAEGKLVMFCDAHVHTAWNHTPNRRFVLILDIMRPEYAAMTNWVCFKVWFAILRQWWKTRSSSAKKA